jgi:hypothetical protein
MAGMIDPAPVCSELGIDTTERTEVIVYAIAYLKSELQKARAAEMSARIRLLINEGKISAKQIRIKP